AACTVVGCDASGRIDPDAVAATVRADTALVSVMLVNNETGTVQDVAAIASAVRERNPQTLVHTDAVQALGRIAVDVRALGTDLLLAVLDGDGVCASGGSACASGAPVPSHVLMAMGLDEALAAGALRCTVGRGTTPDAVERAARTIVAAVERLSDSAARGLRQ